MCPAEEVNKDESAESVAVDESPQASAAEDAGGVVAEARGSVKKAEFQDVVSGPEKGEKPGMELLMNVTLPVSVELGRATMTIQEVLGISAGSVIELERVAGEPVDILVSGKLLGKGEVVVVDDKFGVRITELINRLEGIEQ
jgi:flagellar motor switch protein FliN/FliY